MEEEEKIYVQDGDKVVEVTEDAVPVPGESETVPENPTRDVSSSIGFIAAVCQTIDKDKQDECWTKIEPLESEGATPDDAVDALADILISFGPAGAKEVKTGMDQILESARAKAEPELVRKGKLKIGERLW